MALITKENQRYIRVIKDYTENGIIATSIEYETKDSRELEKKYEEFKIALPVIVEEALGEYYARMLQCAETIGYTDEDVSVEGLARYRDAHPEFDRLYVRYYRLFDENIDLKMFYDNAQDCPNCPEIYEACNEKLRNFDIKSIEEFNLALKDCNPKTTITSVLLDIDKDVNLSGVYTFLKQTGRYIDVFDDL